DLRPGGGDCLVFLDDAVVASGHSEAEEAEEEEEDAGDNAADDECFFHIISFVGFWVCFNYKLGLALDSALGPSFWSIPKAMLFFFLWPACVLLRKGGRAWRARSFLTPFCPEIRGE